MAVSLAKHYPDDSYFLDDAIANVAAWYMKEMEVEALLSDLYHSGPDTLRKLNKSIEAEIAVLRRADNAALTP